MTSLGTSVAHASHCGADLDGDDVVSGADLAVLLAGWGTGDALLDLSGDGIVDGADLAVLLANWGPCPVQTPIADLLPSVTTWHDNHDGTATIEASVINVGNASVASLMVSVIPVDGLGPVVSATAGPATTDTPLEFSIDLINPEFIALANRDLQFIVDPSDVVPEVRESNNAARLYLHTTTWVNNLANMMAMDGMVNTVSLAVVNDPSASAFASQLAIVLGGIAGNPLAATTIMYSPTDDPTIVATTLLMTNPDALVFVGFDDGTIPLMGAIGASAPMALPMLRWYATSDVLDPAQASGMGALAGSGIEQMPPIRGFSGGPERPSVPVEVGTSGHLLGYAAPAGVLSQMTLPALEILLTPTLRDTRQDLIDKSQELYDKLIELEDRGEDVGAMLDLLDAFLQNPDASAGELAGALADILSALKTLLPSFPGLEQFLDVYIDAINQISSVLDSITEAQMQSDIELGIILHPAVWPGGYAMNNYFMLGTISDNLIDWVIKNRKVLKAFVGGEPVKWITKTFLGFDCLWPDSPDRDHVRQWIMDNREGLKRFVYGALADSIP
jgi:hypothetical protein